MSACATRARWMRSRSSRNSSWSRVSTARMPGSALMRSASARAIASVTSFSCVPSVTDGAGVLAAVAGIDGDDDVAAALVGGVRGDAPARVRAGRDGRDHATEVHQQRAAPGVGPVSGERRVSLDHDPQRAPGLGAKAHRADRPAGRGRVHARAAMGVAQVDDDAVGVREPEERLGARPHPDRARAAPPRLRHSCTPRSSAARRGEDSRPPQRDDESRDKKSFESSSSQHYLGVIYEVSGIQFRVLQCAERTLSRLSGAQPRLPERGVAPQARWRGRRP